MSHSEFQGTHWVAKQEPSQGSEGNPYPHAHLVTDSLSADLTVEIEYLSKHPPLPNEQAPGGIPIPPGTRQDAHWSKSLVPGLPIVNLTAEPAAASWPGSQFSMNIILEVTPLAQGNDRVSSPAKIICKDWKRCLLTPSKAKLHRTILSTKISKYDGTTGN